MLKLRASGRVADYGTELQAAPRQQALAAGALRDQQATSCEHQAEQGRLQVAAVNASLEQQTHEADRNPPAQQMRCQALGQWRPHAPQGHAAQQTRRQFEQQLQHPFTLPAVAVGR
jgi:hypothetical protein